MTVNEPLITINSIILEFLIKRSRDPDGLFLDEVLFLPPKRRTFSLLKRLRIRRMCAGGGERQLGELAFTDACLHQQHRATPSLFESFFSI